MKTTQERLQEIVDLSDNRVAAMRATSYLKRPHGPTDAEMASLEKLAANQPKVYAGYSRMELSAAFDKVRNAKNWKYPIDRIIDAADQQIVDAAICFFCGGQAEFTATRSGKLRVKAPGYYIVIGS